MLSENYKYLMSKYKLGHLDWNLSLIQRRRSVPGLGGSRLGVAKVFICVYLLTYIILLDITISYEIVDNYQTEQSPVKEWIIIRQNNLL